MMGFLFPFVRAQLWYSMRRVWSATLKPNIQFLLIHMGKKDQVVQLGGDVSSQQLSLKRHVQTAEVICHRIHPEFAVCVSLANVTWNSEAFKIKHGDFVVLTWAKWNGELRNYSMNSTPPNILFFTKKMVILHSFPMIFHLSAPSLH